MNSPLRPSRRRAGGWTGEQSKMEGVSTQILGATALAFFAMVAIDGRGGAGLPDIVSVSRGCSFGTGPACMFIDAHTAFIVAPTAVMCCQICYHTILFCHEFPPEPYSGCLHASVPQLLRALCARQNIYSTFAMWHAYANPHHQQQCC